MKTIRQIADEIGVSKTAVNKQIANLGLRSGLRKNGNQFAIDEHQEALIKEAFSEKSQTEIENQTQTKTQTENHEVSDLVCVLQATIDTLQGQLEVKDRQIEKLTEALVAAQQTAAAAHAGWRGLCDGVLEETVKCFQSAPEEIIAWFGPAIGPNAFQVGKEVIEQFMAFDPIAETAFRPDPNESGKYLGNLYQIATQRLNKLGITQIYGGEHCTFNEKESFFSYRRDGKTGRMASLIWIKK